jgi:hypothetical protein
MRFAQISDVTKKIKHAVDNKLPLSLVRLGDGEFAVIRYPKYTDEQLCKARIGRWFRSVSLSSKQLKSIRNQILIACQNATILGIPSIREQKVYGKWRQFRRYANEYGILRKNKILFHFYKIQNINYNLILRKLDEVSCITCRDVSEGIKKRFSINKVNVFKIPPELFLYNKRIKDRNKNTLNRKHYPDVFKEIVSYLQNNDLTGKVFLIGAGGLGKSYCHFVKEAGGIGLDIGALFDGWAGLYTRPFLKNPNRYKL